MTIGIVLLLLFLFNCLNKFVDYFEDENNGTGCGTVILSVIYLTILIWMICRFWNTPF